MENSMELTAFLKSWLPQSWLTPKDDGDISLLPAPKMNVVYALDPLTKSIFLAGPTPRSPEVASWRPEALKTLAWLDFKGEVFVPESSDLKPHEAGYDNQVWWELEALEKATVVVFWVPRDLETMPAFTTNVEFGMLVKSGKVLLGAPEGAPKMNYLKMVAAKYNVKFFDDLDDLLKEAVTKAANGGRG
jgi:hypothetical protein